MPSNLLRQKGHGVVVRILKEYRNITNLEMGYLEHDEGLMNDGIRVEELSDGQQLDDESAMDGIDTDDTDTDNIDKNGPSRGLDTKDSESTWDFDI